MLIVLVQLPPVQALIGSQAANALKNKFGTEVSIGKVNLGFLNRIIIDDVMMKDQQGDSMIYASRISVKVDLLPLKEGKISISSAQLFGLNANLYKQNAKSKTNFQFLLDSLASKDTTKHTPLDLHIGSIIIRHGAIAYNQRDVAAINGVFSPKHIGIRELSTHITLDHLTDTDIHLAIKKLSFLDKSGLQLKDLRFKLDINQQEAILKNFRLALPHSQVELMDLHATYRMQDGKIVMPSLQFKGGIKPSQVTLSDIASLVPTLRKFNDELTLGCNFSGTSTSLRCPNIHLKTRSGSILFNANGKIANFDFASKKEKNKTATDAASMRRKKDLHWNVNINALKLSGEGIKQIAKNFGKKINIPQEVLRLGDIYYKGIVYGKEQSLGTQGNLHTDVGNVSLKAEKKGENLMAHIDTKGIQLDKILNSKQLGILTATLDVHGTKKHLFAKGSIPRFDFNKYNYRNIKVDGSYNQGLLDGLATIADPNIDLQVSGQYNIKKKQYAATVNINHLQPSILGVKMADPSYTLNNISVSAKNEGSDSYFDLAAPFADIHVKGQYDYATLYQSCKNLVASKLPTLPGIGKISNQAKNNFSINLEIRSTEILRRMLGIPLEINSPIYADGMISDKDKAANLYANIPGFEYNGKAFSSGLVNVHTQGDTLKLNASIQQGAQGTVGPIVNLKAAAANNSLATQLHYDNRSKKLPVNATLQSLAQFYKNQNDVSTAHISILPSQFKLGDKPWEVHPAEITYSKNHLEIDHIAASHNQQHIIIDGLATPNKEDSIVADLKDVDVAYKLEQIDINAVADNGPEHQTLIDGYVSPKRNYIDLGIEARGTSMKFLENFCGSFMNNVEAWGNGKLNVVGDLSNINLVGDIVAHGKMHMKQLNTDYTFNSLRAHAIPDDIQLKGDTIYDRNNNFAIVNGGIHHKHLTKLSYDLDLKAHNFLGYDTHEFGDNTFYGTVYATGEVGIHGKSGETIIDINAEPEKGSIFVYNVASPDAISDKSFIHWHEIVPELADSISKQMALKDQEDDDIDFSSDMRINFLVNTNQNLTLKLIMDEQSGDYISLNGNGVIRANYYNKGAFDMFGNYVVDHGMYKLTIQNLIKKEFEFMPGGTIAFGGNPYNAPLNLQAKYTVNGVPLSDLSIGKSFSSNNIRVDCLMNITGTPESPKVDFSMDLPTVNSDAKQMIYSIINSQEEMNQQVLYLLGIGRFYAQTNNNQASEDAAQQSQTSLAMQSLLSGTISQQINTVLSNVVKSNNWNFGANISTGDEGFNNAEYEGILSGKLLNNRLLFNGQFGYRDNANATQSFIGDFDMRYLIFPNGNLAIRMYNQTNDRYFTRNSLNTQGLGLIMKKDFNGWRDFFGINRLKKKKKKSGKK